MVERCYEVTLLSDVAITADAATVGGHTGLDYLPGSLFLGAAVAASLEEGAPFDAEFFLSGRVRFLDALPVLEGAWAFPVPLCFHKIKGEEWEGHAPYNALTPGNLRREQQPQPWRKGYMTTEGAILEDLGLTYRMKTAIDRTARRSAEGKLFGYEALPAGSIFRCRVQGDRQEDLERVNRWIGGQRLRLGRSRSAEYGAVEVRLLQSSEGILPSSGDPRQLVLYLLSDLALIRDGVPVLLPRGEDFGVQGSTLCLERSFLRSRRYAPWNAFFNGRMAERQVLTKGSVLCFTTKDPVDPVALQKALERGVGCHRQEGLGQIWVNPSWVLSPPPLRKGRERSPAGGTPKEPTTELVQYLKQKAEKLVAFQGAYETGLAWAEEWFALSKKIAADGQKVPGKTQWSSLREMAVRFQRDPKGLREKVAAFCHETLRRRTWEAADGKHRTLKDAVLAKFSESPENPESPSLAECLALYHASVEMGRRLARPTEGKRKGGSRR